MAEHPGYMNLEDIQTILKITPEEMRALISMLNIQATIFPEDKRRRWYRIEDVERMKLAIGR